MGDSTTHSYSIECPECDVEEGSDDFVELVEFMRQHKNYTSHSMVWSRLDFDEGEVATRSQWENVCETCDKKWVFGCEERALETAVEHDRYTDHHLDRGPEENIMSVVDTLRCGETINSGSIDARMIRPLIANLGMETEEVGPFKETSVPLEVLYATVCDAGVSPDQFRKAHLKFKQNGPGYEPEPGYVAVRDLV